MSQSQSHVGLESVSSSVSSPPSSVLALCVEWQGRRETWMNRPATVEVEEKITEKERMEEDLYVEYSEKLYAILFAELEGRANAFFASYSLEEAKRISKQDRALLSNSQSNLVYGEVIFTTFAHIMVTYVNVPFQGTFYDLGSGTGRSLVAASMLYKWKKICGVEILPGLYAASQDIVDRYNHKVALQNDVEHKVLNNIVLIHGDLLNVDWSDGDVVFVNSTCFDDNLLAQISNLASRLKKGAYMITLTRGIQNKKFKELHAQQHDMCMIYFFVCFM